jgi:hypothetical protein
MQENYYLIAIKAPDIEPMIKALASEDMRSIGNEAAWLIRKEYYARHPKTLAELNSHASSIAETTGDVSDMS